MKRNKFLSSIIASIVCLSGFSSTFNTAYANEPNIDNVSYNKSKKKSHNKKKKHASKNNKKGGKKGSKKNNKAKK